MPGIERSGHTLCRMSMMTPNIKTATNTVPHTIPMMAMCGNSLDEGSFLPKANKYLHRSLQVTSCNCMQYKIESISSCPVKR